MARITAGELAIFQEGMNESQRTRFLIQYEGEKKDRHVALVLSILAGVLGMDRFYLGNVRLGTLKLLTVGVFGVLAVLDWFRIMGKTDEVNRQRAVAIATSVKLAV